MAGFFYFAKELVLMKDITEFKAWFNNEISQYPLIAKEQSALAE